MGKSGPTERRKYRRIATDQVISFAQVEERDVLGVGLDVSEGGIRFEALGCEIELGDVLRVTFNLAEHTVVAVGRVIWVTEVDPISTEVGLEFLQIDEAARSMLEEMGSEAEL